MTKKLDEIIGKIRPLLAQLSYLPRALQLVWTAARNWTLTWLLLLIIQGLLPAVSVALTKRLVDALVRLIDAAGTRETILSTLTIALFFGAVMALTQLLSRASEWVRTIQSELVGEHVATLVHRQSVALDMRFYDSPAYYDHLFRARAQASFRPVSLLDNLGSLLQSGITLVTLVALLIPYSPWLPLVLFLATLPLFYVMLRHNQLQHDWYVQTTSDQRRASYYDWLLTARATAAELRLFRLGEPYQVAYQALRRRLRQARMTLLRRQTLSELLANLYALLITAAAMIWMVWQLLQGLATLGDLTLFYQAFSQGQAAMRSMLSNVGQLYINTLFLQHFFEFLELEPQVQDPPHPLPPPATLSDAIRFSQVNFKYPGSRRAALQGFDLTIPAGRVTAVVGSNGAGKSTLIKLLCRLYDPHSGHIQLDGTDIRDYRIADLHRLITILFQEPVHYQDTVFHNITLGDLNGKADRRAVQDAAIDAGADDLVAGLSHGFDHQLGTWFEGGTELSVGEWQRIALARAFHRQSPIIILDEPTSAMDPWKEADWLRRFRKLAQGRTALVITHRFTTARYADIIHVMERGRIIESGSHDELLNQHGRYAESWNEQMRQPSPAFSNSGA